MDFYRNLVTWFCWSLAFKVWEIPKVITKMEIVETWRNWKKDNFPLKNMTHTYSSERS